MPEAIDLSTPTGGSVRLKGSLAAGTVVGNSTIARERIHVAGMASVHVRAIGTAVTSDPTVQVIPQKPGTPGNNVAVVNNVATGLTTATALVTDTEALHEYTLKGEQYVDVVVDSDSGDAVTITSIDVSVKPT